MCKICEPGPTRVRPKQLLIESYVNKMLGSEQFDYKCMCVIIYTSVVVTGAVAPTRIRIRNARLVRWRPGYNLKIPGS